MRIRSVVLAMSMPVLLAVTALAADADVLVRAAAEDFRHQVNEYQDRVNQLNFSRAPSPGARQGMHDTIVNNYRVHLTAMTRARDGRRRELAGMRGVSPAERSDANRRIGTVYNTEVRTLQMHEQDALRRLREAERR